MSGQAKEKPISIGTAIRNFSKVFMPCYCIETPEIAYKKGEDLLTSDLARACRLCGRAILPSEFSEPTEE